MALDQKALQKKRAKREQKRQYLKPKVGGFSGASSLSREWARAGQAPIADVFVPTTLLEQGIGTVWLSRHLPDGRFAIVGFLVDTFCLGVKDALYKIVEGTVYPGTVARIHETSQAPMDRQHPSCARKLVEAAAAYAKDLGFEPPAEYRIARLIFGDIDAQACPTTFRFGKDGKPFFVNGPYDTLATQRRILKQLERRCGPGGYNYLMALDEPLEPLR